jgi:hypothetical protein
MQNARMQRAEGPGIHLAAARGGRVKLPAARFHPAKSRRTTMSRIGALIFGILVGGGLVYGALNYHVVRTESGHEFIPKKEMSFDETYVDARNFGLADWAKHADLAQAILKADKGHLINESAVKNLTNGVKDLFGKLGEEENLR